MNTSKIKGIRTTPDSSISRSNIARDIAIIIIGIILGASIIGIISIGSKIAIIAGTIGIIIAIIGGSSIAIRPRGRPGSIG